MIHPAKCPLKFFFHKYFPKWSIRFRSISSIKSFGVIYTWDLIKVEKVGKLSHEQVHLQQALGMCSFTGCVKSVLGYSVSRARIDERLLATMADSDAGGRWVCTSTGHHLAQTFTHSAAQPVCLEGDAHLRGMVLRGGRFTRTRCRMCDSNISKFWGFFLVKIRNSMAILVFVMTNGQNSPLDSVPLFKISL